MVGLESFTVSEDVGVVELCARVFEPDIDCPIEFPFNVVLFSTDRTAGIYKYLSHIKKLILKLYYSESHGLWWVFSDLDFPCLYNTTLCECDYCE